MIVKFKHRVHRVWQAGLALTVLPLHFAFAADLSATVNFNIAPQALAAALLQYSAQSGIQVTSPAELLDGLKSGGVKGSIPAQNALTQLLLGTELGYRMVDSGTVTIIPTAPMNTAGSTQAEPQNILRLVRAEESVPSVLERQSAAAERDVLLDAKGVPEIMVKGSRALNVDIKRSQEDPQPYVVLGREEIERSQATSIENFLKTRLPMNTTGFSIIEGGSTTLNRSQINLRGLGVNQTLILLNGRRLAGKNLTTEISQADVNGIPLSAIERIEVLPSTASGIYGGGATGGVVNIVTRSDYRGSEIGARYGISSRGDAADYRVDGSGGFNLDQGRINVLMTGSYAKSDPLFNGDRAGLRDAGIALLLANNPAAIYNTTSSSTFPLVGSLPNIRSANGSNLVLKNGTALNSPFTFVPRGYAGTDAGAALAGNAGRYDLNLANDQRNALATLRAGTEVASASLTARRDFGDHVSAFTEFSWNKSNAKSYSASGTSTVQLAATAPNNPFTAPINVSFPTVGLRDLGPFASASKSDTQRAAGGVMVKLPRRWTAGADFTYSREKNVWTGYDRIITGDPDGAGPGLSISQALQAGVLNVMRDVNQYPLDWAPYLVDRDYNYSYGPATGTMKDGTVRLSGPIRALPGGDVILTGMIERRREDAGRALYWYAGDPLEARNYGDRSQQVQSYYGELRAPLISRSNARTLLHGLELQASVRRDEYTTRVTDPIRYALATRETPLPEPAFPGRTQNEVSATKFTVALKYAPGEDLYFRASYGTGFLPPSISQISPSGGSGTLAAVLDPKRGNLLVSYFASIVGGGNPGLIPEESKSFSAGVVFTPRLLAGFRFSVDYTEIDKTNEIRSLTNQQIFNYEDLFPGSVTRLPLTPADAALGYTGGVVTAIDASLKNVASTSVQAFDTTADYSFVLPRVGDFHIYTIATYQPGLRRKILPTDPNYNFAASNLKWRGNLGVTWSRNAVSVDWNAQYYDRYKIYGPDSSPAQVDSAVLNQGSHFIPSQIYHDLMVKYRLSGRAGSVLAATDISLGVENIFDRKSPVRASNSPSVVGHVTPYGDARLQRFSLVLRSQF